MKKTIYTISALWLLAGIVYAIDLVAYDPKNFPAQAANTVIAGPTSGVNAVPTARVLVEADIPTGIVIPIGGIILWSGTLATIPTHFQLCDGTNGTPNLTNGFTKCVSSGQNPGSTGGSATASYTPAGTNGTVSFTPAGTNGTVSFTPTGTVSAPTFTGNTLATHTHDTTSTGTNTSPTFNILGVNYVTTAGTSAGAHSFNGTTLANGTNNVSAPAQTFTGNSVTSSATSGGTPAGTNSVPTFTGSSGSVPAETFTGNAGTVPAETFTGSTASIATEPVYYKLAYIMRIS